uniref:G protein-coupled receptor GPR1 n=1 Tax=Stemphylium eturmiunum TaxID=235069 RepID=A0A2L1GG84_9PLEO|nr:G protein-coupled receptor GPR1 [Stemphylium eturmiunum]
MLLIYGDLVRASWFFIAAVLMEVHGTVRTESAFCQSSGFLIQYGTETNDLAVLVIAVHSALQVFHPSNQTSSDGLYPYRRYVYASAFLIPGVMASLAFIQRNWGYLSQGAFCTLPIRPFWYRLALAWIPRYCIVLTIIGLTAAIYIYVGWEFKKYNRASQHIEDSTMEDTAGNQIDTGTLRMGTPLSANEYIPGEGFVTRPPSMTQQDHLGQHGWHAPSMSQDHILSRPRRRSSVSFGCVVPCSASSLASIRTPSISTTTHSLTGSTRNTHLNRSGTFRPPLVAIPSGHTVQTIESTDNVQLPLSLQTTNSILVTTTTTTSTTPAPSLMHRAPSNQTLSTFPEPSDPEFSPMTRRRARMHRQLRLMFIYPIVYTLMWLLPFVNHCMMYNDYYAAHPVWGLRLAGTICIASMGS